MKSLFLFVYCIHLQIGLTHHVSRSRELRHVPHSYELSYGVCMGGENGRASERFVCRSHEMRYRSCWGERQVGALAEGRSGKDRGVHLGGKTGGRRGEEMRSGREHTKERGVWEKKTEEIV